MRTRAPVLDLIDIISKPIYVGWALDEAKKKKQANQKVKNMGEDKKFIKTTAVWKVSQGWGMNLKGKFRQIHGGAI